MPSSSQALPSAMSFLAKPMFYLSLGIHIIGTLDVKYLYLSFKMPTNITFRNIQRKPVKTLPPPSSPPPSSPAPTYVYIDAFYSGFQFYVPF